MLFRNPMCNVSVGAIRYRIETPWIPRMALAYPSEGKIEAPDGSVGLNSFSCIYGAGGMKTTVAAQDRAQDQPVESNHDEYDFLHRFSIRLQWSDRLLCRLCLLCFPMPGRLSITKSATGNSA